MTVHLRSLIVVVAVVTGHQLAQRPIPGAVRPAPLPAMCVAGAGRVAR